MNFHTQVDKFGIHNPVVNGHVGVFQDQGTNDHSVWFTPHHVVKKVYTELGAKREVAVGNALRVLGHTEVPKHHYATHDGKHYVVSERLHDTEPLGDTKHEVKVSQQKLADMIASEKALGVGDRHPGNYLVHSSGTVHPIDFGTSFRRPGQGLGLSALHWKLEHPIDHPVSEEHQARLRKYQPLIRALWKRFGV